MKTNRQLGATRNAQPCALRTSMWWLSICLLASLGGCAWSGKTSGNDPLYPAGRTALSPALELPEGIWPADKWWQEFGDAQLDMLVDRALRDAPTLAIATARIKEGQALVDAVEASHGANIGLAAMVNRERVSGDGFLGLYAHQTSAIGATGPWYSEGIVGLTGSYSVDLWGKERAQLEAAIGVEQAREAEAAETKLSLSSRIVTVYYEWQSTRAQIDLLSDAEGIRHQSLLAHAARVERGLEAQMLEQKAHADDVDAAQKSDAARTRARVLAEILRALCGAGPSDLAALDPMPLPGIDAGVPRELGIELLARRPDLQALRFHLTAALGRIEAAKAAFYPSFDIRAFFGHDAIHLEDVMNASSRQFNLIPGLHLPLFDSGRLNANLETARMQRNLLVAHYHQAIVEAIRQVAQSGVELDSAVRQIALQQRRVAHLDTGRASAAAYADAGLADAVSAEEARLPLLAEQGRLIELRAAALRARVALAAALGGGYHAERQTLAAEGGQQR